MVEEDISQEFRLQNKDEIRYYFLEEIKQNKLMSRKHKKVCATLNSKLYLTLPSFSFCNYWMYFGFSFCFFAWYSYRNYEFCHRFENLCNSLIND